MISLSFSPVAARARTASPEPARGSIETERGLPGNVTREEPAAFKIPIPPRWAGVGRGRARLGGLRHGGAWLGGGPLPPYDKGLPPQYWASLQKPASKPHRLWMLVLVLLGACGAIGLLCWTTTLLVSGAHLPPQGVPHLAPNPEPAPRAVSTGRYWVDLPDGRHVLVNFKGEVPDKAHLPPQPRGGANNAAYYDQSTGNTWIWTVPLGASNVPQWIDP